MNDAGEAIARGKAIVAISGSPRLDLAPYLAAGVTIDARNFGNTPETVYRGTDGTTLGVFNQAPHPNAARLFINWIMTKRVSELMEQSQGSARAKRRAAGRSQRGADTGCYLFLRPASGERRRDAPNGWPS